MPSKRAYRRVSVNQIELETLRELALERGGHGTTVGLDVAKEEIVVVVRWGDQHYERPWKVENPFEIDALIERLVVLKETCDSLCIGLESTGTYSEAVRYAMTLARLEVHRVSGKSVADYKEIFDGVPSQHDGKDAAMIAELTCFQKGTAWPWQEPSEDDQEMSHQVKRLDAFRSQATQWTGRIEGMLSKHWPEATRLVTLTSVTLLKTLQQYGSPAKLASDPDAAANLRKFSRGNLPAAKIQKLIESARTTAGIPMCPADIDWLCEIVTETIAALDQWKLCVKRLQKIAREHETMSQYADVFGATTLCVVWACVGDPRRYGSSGAFLKALGLNLMEQSSGKRKGELAITKRGPSLARKHLYFLALRAVQRKELESWYKTFQKVGKNEGGGSEHRKMKGLVAMMRKLSRSLWFVVQHDLEFDYAKVFPGKPLEKRKSGRRRRRSKEAAARPA